MSWSSSSKLKTSRLLCCLWALLDLGRGMNPCCKLQRMSTCTMYYGCVKGQHCSRGDYKCFLMYSLAGPLTLLCADFLGI